MVDFRMPSITRRDFLNGTALAVAAGLTPAAQLAAAPGRYCPPALTGLRGQHPGSFEVAHAFAREGRRFGINDAAIEEHYDLVVVGGGISGLSAAWFYRRAAGPGARILIIDNHDDFGGHAKRNEFTVGRRMLIGYGGSQSMQSPKTLWSDVAKRLLRDLGVEIGRFDTAFDRGFYASLGLLRGVFFDRETFGRDTLIAGDPLLSRHIEAGDALAKFVAAIPIADSSKQQLLSLYDSARDPLADRSNEEKLKILKSMSYRDYLIKICGCSAEVANCFQGRPLGFFGLGCDAVPAFDLRSFGYPGFAGLGLAAEEQLDRAEHKVRIRLLSTVLDVRQTADGVSVGYVRDDGAAHRVVARHAILACFHMMIPFLAPELPKGQREALALNVKTPLVYTNVVIRNWRSWLALKVSDIAAPMGFFTHAALDFPVDLGGYRHPRDPDEPIVVHLVHVPGVPNSGLDARAQFRVGQAKLFAMTFADFEDRIRDQLDRMLGAGGFVSARDIAAITVNRWPHGYGYVANSLYDGNDYEDRILKVARQPFGRIAIANSDAGGDAYAHLAINEAARAVREVLS